MLLESDPIASMRAVVSVGSLLEKACSSTFVLDFEACSRIWTHGSRSFSMLYPGGGVEMETVVRKGGFEFVRASSLLL